MSRTAFAFCLAVGALVGVGLGSVLGKEAHKAAAFENRPAGYSTTEPVTKHTTELRRLAYGTAKDQVVAVTTDRWLAVGGEFTVTTATYPASFAAVPAEKILAGVRDGIQGKDGLGGQLLKDEPIVVMYGVAKLDGREFKIGAGKQFLRVRAVVVNAKLYVAMTVGPQKTVDSAAANDFLNNFRVLAD